MDIKKINRLDFKGISPKGVGKSLGLFWIKYFKVFFTIFFILVIGFSAYLWYQNLYQLEWDESEKMQYIVTQYEGKDLKRDTFDQVVQKSKEKEVVYNGELQFVKGIFDPF